MLSGHPGDPSAARGGGTFVLDLRVPSGKRVISHTPGTVPAQPGTARNRPVLVIVVPGISPPDTAGLPVGPVPQGTPGGIGCNPAEAIVASDCPFFRAG
jgi:hypothetical protein